MMISAKIVLVLFLLVVTDSSSELEDQSQTGDFNQMQGDQYLQFEKLFSQNGDNFQSDVRLPSNMSPDLMSQLDTHFKTKVQVGHSAIKDFQNLIGGQHGSNYFSMSMNNAGGKQCPPRPGNIMNASLRCTSTTNTCKATCLKDYQFPNGQTQLYFSCVKGEWMLKDSEWAETPSCEPICMPQCKNKGICISPGQCQCPQNFMGAQCQFEKKLCLSLPPLSKNSRRSCTDTTCSITCMKGHRFPDGSTMANMECKNGQWLPTRTDLSVIPDCQPTCNPSCQNGGNCLSFNMCQCPPTFRGPQCQYNVEVCAPAKKLQFNGGYNCSGTQDSMSCSVYCPPGIKFDYSPASVYTCEYASGKYMPDKVPQCVFGANMEIVPLSGTSQTFYHSFDQSLSGHGAGTKTKYKVQKEDDEDDEVWEKVITKTKVIKVRKKGGAKKDGSMYYETDDGFEESQSQMPGVYTLYMTGGVAIKHRTPNPAICLIWNGNKVKTFDGLIYNTDLSCSHTVAQDFKDGSFSVVQTICPYENDGCVTKLEVYLQDLLYTFKNNGETVELFTPKKQLPLPAQVAGMRVTFFGVNLKIELDAIGLTIVWDTNRYLTVEATAALWNRTAGLCGTMDQDPSNDFMTKNGAVQKTPKTFVDSWTVSNDKYDCKPPQMNEAIEMQCTDDQQSKALKICKQLVENSAFSKCLEKLNEESILQNCISDYCFCKDSSNPNKCACDSVSVFIKDCQFQGVTSSEGWRDMAICPINCKKGRVYMPCGPAQEATCGGATELTQKSCNEGCFCPEGTVLHENECIPKKLCPCMLRGKIFKPQQQIVKDCNTCTCENGSWKCTDVTCGARCGAIGDPHYITFDGKRYDFMGKCSYHLMKTENISIEAENVACPGSISQGMDYPPSTSSDMPSCTKSVTIEFPFATGTDVKKIQLKQGRIILIDGMELKKTPRVINNGLARIKRPSTNFVTVNFKDGLKVWWDGQTRVYIDAPSTYRGKTKGLCGTFNSNLQDDFLTPEGDVETAIEPFADKWKTKESCPYLTDKMKVPHPCQVNVDKKGLAEKICGKIRDKVFEDCHWSVDLTPFYDDCMYDMCACNGDSASCSCPIFSAYATECARQGSPLSWRYKVSECEIKCPAGQVYEECGDSCSNSCEDVQSEEECKPECVEGCRCPAGQVLNENYECIPVGLCPCFYKGLTFQPGYKEVRPGTKHLELCKCSGKWICEEAKDGDEKKYPPAADLKSKCQASQNQDFTTCEPAEPLTCKNMHVYQPTSAAECLPGCICKKGFVLDVSLKKCVLPTDCSCHHGGRSYNDGDKMQEECNTCQCNGGKWSCTTRACASTCSAWGDSHFETFDGKQFDFQGACDYLLSKGVLEGGDGYSVVIQNILCGSMGVTCSKSITITLLRPKDESITLSADDKDLISTAKSTLKHLVVYRAGVFVVVEAPGLELQIKWDRGTRVYIQLGSRWKGRVQGLCGNNNGNALDDFKSPSSGLESSPTIFGDSWRLQDFCKPSTEQINSCQEHPHRKIWSQRKCEILKSGVFKACHSEVPVESYMKRCVFDTCACDQGGDCECLCTALSAYAYACSMRGVVVKWRTPDLCPMQCDPHCSEYSPCVSTCEIETCDNVLDQAKDQRMCHEDTCVEGCKFKPCASDEIYFNASYTQCVSKQICKPVCLIKNGVTYYEGDLMSSDKCQKCSCTRGKEICSGEPCTEPPLPSRIETFTEQPWREQDHQCAPGWSAWINQDVGGAGVKTGIKTKTKLTKTNDKEPVPSYFLLKNAGSAAACPPEKMTKIECRTVGKHEIPKATGEHTECSLERGLICTGKCSDYEIRVYCQCDETTTEAMFEFIFPKTTPKATKKSQKYTMPIGLLDVDQVTAERHLSTTSSPRHTPKKCDPSIPHVEYPGDCYKFLHCQPSNDGNWAYVEKTCGPSMMFNPVSMVCDWTYSVAKIKPVCDGAPPVLTTTPVPFEKPSSKLPGLSDKQIITVGPVIALKSCDPTVPHVEVPGDCHKFFHCQPTDKGNWEFAEKTCGPTMMFNPTAMVCDWIYSVVAIKPVCGDKPTVTSTSASQLKCPPGFKWNDCIIPCDKTCHFFKKTLIKEGKCQGSSFECVDGCEEDSSAAVSCPPGHFWRDRSSCTKPADCPCLSNNSVFVKPNDKITENGCQHCQCVENTFICDESDCSSSETIIEEKTKTVIKTKYRSTKKPATEKTIELFEVPQAITKAPEVPFIIPTTATPPRECDPSNLTPMIDGDYPLADSAFTASSHLGGSFKPEFSRLNAQPTETSSGSWSPKINDQMQYLQITFPKPTPLFGVILRGSPIFDQYVTSFKILYSTDDIAYHYLVDESKGPQIFKGPVDNRTPVKNTFKIPIEPKSVRIYPLTWHESIAIRAELLGCAPQIKKTTVPIIRIPLTTAIPIFTTKKVDIIPIPVFEDEKPMCDDPMGLDNGKLDPTQIKVSSSKSEKTKLPDPHAALKLSSPVAWRPAIESSSQFVLFDFLEPRNLTGFKTKGGPNGWVTAFNALYSSDDFIWNKVQLPNGDAKIFLGNFDNNSPKENYFKYPIQARFLKLVPTKWHQAIELRAEPLGCFKSYPPIEKLPTKPTPTEDPNCATCPGVEIPTNKVGCKCPAAPYWNGQTCVPRSQCPCMVGHIQYDVGAKYESDDCSECVCILGGLSQCRPKECPKCPKNLRPVKSTSCRCLCEPCPPQHVLCPSSGACISESSWCDGIQDCPDDEVMCSLPTIITTIQTIKTVTKKCPKPLCPPGFKVVMKPSSASSSTSKTSKTSGMFQTSTKVQEQLMFTSTKNSYKNRKSSKFTELAVPDRAPTPINQEQCAEYTCSPSAEFLRQETQMLVECPIAQCPPGYEVVVTPSSTYGGCAEFECETIPDKDAICNVTGRTFSTFDDTEFKYDICSHVLARDLVDDEWKIIVTKDCSAGNFVCNKKIIINDKKSSHELTLNTDLTVDLNGYHYTVDQLKQTSAAKANVFSISKVGNTLLYISHIHGFWVSLDQDADIKVGVSSSKISSVDGLCGYYNGLSYDDKRLPNGDPSDSTIQFGDSWLVDKTLKDECQPHACSKEMQEKAWKICNSVRDEVFGVCVKAVDIDKFVSSCLETTCDCLKASNSSSKDASISIKECKCNMLQNFVTECLTTDSSVHLDTWRSVYGCDAICDAPLVHKDCFRRRCEPTCENLATDECPQISGSCFSGCYCPEGHVRKGEKCVPIADCRDCVCDGFGKSEYLTYDRKNFTVDGNCTYLLTRDIIIPGIHTFQVYVSVGPCDDNAAKGAKSPKNKATCAKSLHIIYGEHMIHMQREPSKKIKTFIDGIPATNLPVDKKWIQVKNVPNQGIDLILPESQVTISSSFDDLSFSIQLPSLKYGQKLEGLCGNCNGNPDDDLKANPKNAIPGKDSINDVISSWLADDPKLSLDEKNCITEEAVMDECIPLPPEKDPCLKFLEEDLFGKCHMIVDPYMYVESCQRDMCTTGPTQMGACESLATYARECQKNGICLNWRSNNLCPFECPSNLEYSPCGCSLTCETASKMTSPTTKSTTKTKTKLTNNCPVSKTEGCFCPDNKILQNGLCIDEKKCRPCITKGYFAGDKYQKDECTNCECDDLGQVVCMKQDCRSLEVVCDKGMKPQVQDKVPGECCPKVICVSEEIKITESLSCTRKPKPDCGPGQYKKMVTSDDGCVKFVCECKPIEDCDPIQKIISPLTPGEKLVKDTSGCCPTQKVVCDKSLCPPKPEKCEKQFYDVVKVDSDWKCCDKYECVPPKEKCIVVVKGKPVLKMVGDVWPTEDPCLEKECIIQSGEVTSTKDKVKKCEVTSCGKGYELKVEENKCCGVCVQVQCILGDKAFEPGKIWFSEDNCTEFSCSLKDSSLIINAKQETCPILDCAESLQYTKGCCKYCKIMPEAQKNCLPTSLTELETLGLVRQIIPVHGLCKNVEPIRGFTECHGSCSSGSKYNPETFTQDKQCECCGIKEMETMAVVMKCVDGFTLKKNVEVPKMCSCQPCSEAVEAKSMPIKSQTYTKTKTKY